MVLPPETAAPKILIVDDQQSNVRLLEQTLRRAGFTAVMSVTEPRDVAAMHLENRYDLILLDLQMPGLNGFEVLAQLQVVKEANPVAVLVLSADATQTKAVLAAGADGFLGKPFKLPDVVDRVHSLLREHPPR